MQRLISWTHLELSGGMDSSSIVCMADALMARGFAETRRLDTVSYFDNSETNWNDSPFFAKVEEQRGRAGRHVALDFREQWRPSFDHRHFAATPGSGVRINDNSRYHECLRSGEYRVLLQGVGGDEVLGGFLPRRRGWLTFFARATSGSSCAN
jgi:asparagine synthase (glutamine-hydrolysing)